MCTSIVLNAGAVYAGRTLDLDVPFGERVAIAPGSFPSPSAVCPLWSGTRL